MIKYAVIFIEPNPEDDMSPEISVIFWGLEDIKLAEKHRSSLLMNWPNSSQNIQVISYKVPE